MLKTDKVNGAYRRETLPTYIERNLLGFPVELIDSVEREICPANGEVITTIPNMPGLIAAACVCRVLIPRKLSGKEIKSLRKALELNGKELAERLAVRAETLSRWENDEDTIGPASEKLLRLYVALQLKHKVALEFNDEQIKQIIEKEIQPFHEPGEGKPEIQLILKRKFCEKTHKDEECWTEPEQEKIAA